MKNLGNRILAELKPNYKQCINCGKMIRVKSKTCPPKYCDECERELQLKRQRNCMKKLRETEICE